MPVTVKVTGGDAAMPYLLDLGRKIGAGKSVRVGFLEKATYPDGTPVALIAAVQNFGAPSRGIPPRPFFTNMVKDKAPEWGPAFALAMKATDNNSVEALARMGEGISGQLRQSIVDTNSPPNSPVTNLLKQRFPMGGQTFADVLKARADVKAGVSAPAGKPLVQSGHLLGSVDYEVQT